MRDGLFNELREERSTERGRASRWGPVGILVLIAVLGVLAFFTGIGEPGRQTDRTPTDTESASTSDTRRKEQVNRDESDSHRDVLRATESAPGTYRFRLDVDLPVDVASSSRVSISLYRGAKKIASGWHFRLGKEQRIRWTARVGDPDRRLPPGLYRVRAKITETGMDVPESFREQVLPNENPSFRNRVLTGDAWVYEVGIRIGSDRAIKQFERRHVRWLKENGSAMVDAWYAWRSKVQSLYETYREGNAVPSSAADTLLQQLRRIRRRCRVFRDRPGRDISYLWTPNPPFESNLQELARILPMKVNALTVTMLEQLIGRVPRDWPKSFRRSGFQSNIDVYHHMNQYHERTISGLRDQLSEWSGLDRRFQSVRAYRRYRLRWLLDIPEAVRQLSADGSTFRFGESSAMDRELRRASLRVFVRYVRRLLTFHTSAFRETVRVMDMKDGTVSHATRTQVLEAVLLNRCRQLYRAMEMEVPDALVGASGPESRANGAIKQFRMLKKRARYSDERRER